MPPTMMYFPQDFSLQGYENNQNQQKTYGVSADISAKEILVPTGFPSVLMSFGDFNVCQAIVKLLKIPSNFDKFQKNLKKGIDDFFKEKGQNDDTEKIVFELKRAIARLYIVKTNVDHVYMEYTRGGIQLLLTGRPRRTVDFSGAIITPAQPNNIRGFRANSFIDDLNPRFSGLIEYFYSLFSYSIKDDAYRLTLEMTLSPWKYCTDQKIEDQIKEVAKCLFFQGK